jgi:hypothetical protein
MLSAEESISTLKVKDVLANEGGGRGKDLGTCGRWWWGGGGWQRVKALLGGCFGVKGMAVRTHTMPPPPKPRARTPTHYSFCLSTFVLHSLIVPPAACSPAIVSSPPGYTTTSTPPPSPLHLFPLLPPLPHYLPPCPSYEP